MLQALLSKRNAVSSTTLDVTEKSARRAASLQHYKQNEDAPLQEQCLINERDEEKTHMHAFFLLKKLKTGTNISSNNGCRDSQKEFQKCFSYNDLTHL
jgi:hypothetical protein